LELPLSIREIGCLSNEMKSGCFVGYLIYESDSYGVPEKVFLFIE
jgi:hypothetical protein